MNVRRSFEAPATRPADDNFDMLAPARDRFRSLIVSRILAFEAFRKQAENPDTVAQALTGISDLAHKISGVGATLGFVRLGTLAGVLEGSIGAGRRTNTPSERLFAAIEPQLEEMLVEMEDQIDA